MVYDGVPEAEEDLRAGIRETEVYLRGEQRDWKVPPEPSEVKRLAGSYRNASLGEVVVRPGRDEVVFQFGDWKSRMATKLNPMARRPSSRSTPASVASSSTLPPPPASTRD